MDLKANQTDVDTAMDAKVNTTDFNTAIPIYQREMATPINSAHNLLNGIFHKAMKIISLVKYAPEN